MAVRAVVLPGALLVGRCLGDGLPVDDGGRITVAHSFVEPDAGQVEEMEALGTIALGRKWWADLRKVSPNTPKRLVGIVSVAFNDCTCGTEVGASRMKDGRIAVLHEEQTAGFLLWKLNTRQDLVFRVDHRGQFHLDGVLVRFAVLLEALEMAKPWSEERKNKAFVEEWER